MSSIDIEVNDQEKYLKSSFITYRSRCKEDNEGNNDKSISKPLESSSFTVGRPFHYPLERYCKTFQIQYNQKLTNTAKFVLSSFKNKYIYYAVDDLLFLKNLNYTEKENLLGFLYSPILSLHNDLSINLFDIWIDEIYINEVNKSNRFINKNDEHPTLTNISINLFYVIRSPSEKPETLW